MPAPALVFYREVISQNCLDGEWGWDDDEEIIISVDCSLIIVMLKADMYYITLRRQKLQTHTRQEWEFSVAYCKSQQKTWLAHTRVSDQEQLEQVVTEQGDVAWMCVSMQWEYVRERENKRKKGWIK